MLVYKVVYVSDLGELKYQEKANAYREPGTLVWDNTGNAWEGRRAFCAGGHYGHAASIREAQEMAKDWKDLHAATIEKIVAVCAEYGFCLAPKKALKEYLKHDGVFQMPHPNYMSALEKNMRRILTVLRNQEIWYQHSKTLRRGSAERQDASDQSYTWSGILSQMTFGHVHGVSPELAWFLKKLTPLKGFEFSMEILLSEES